MTEEDYNRIEIVYGWDTKLSEKYEEGNLQSLRWVQKETAGLDAIPQSLRVDPEMIISNVSGIHAVPVAENVFAFILGVARGIFEASDYMKKNKWIKLEMTDRLFTLNDYKMLVLRIGSIGSQIAKVAKFHGMETIGINSSGREVDNFDETFDTNQLPNVIGSVDFVSNILPGTSQTRVLYDKEFFKGMNQEGYFISVGRGDAVI